MGGKDKWGWGGVRQTTVRNDSKVVSLEGILVHINN